MFAALSAYCGMHALSTTIRFLVTKELGIHTAHAYTGIAVGAQKERARNKPAACIHFAGEKRFRMADFMQERIIDLSPAKEWLGEVCVNEEEGAWCTVVQSQETTAQEVMNQLKKAGYRISGMFLATEDNRPVRQASVSKET